MPPTPPLMPLETPPLPAVPRRSHTSSCSGRGGTGDGGGGDRNGDGGGGVPSMKPPAPLPAVGDGCSRLRLLRRPLAEEELTGHHCYCCDRIHHRKGRRRAL